MPRRLHRAAVVALTLALAAVQGIAAQAAARQQASRSRAGDPLAGFDQYAVAAMKQWKVPGMAIAVVRGDSIILAKGYGVRTVGKTDSVTPRTLFAIGSASKAFTGAALEMLADEGKISFESRVTEYLPWFEMQDPWVTREIRVRDLLLHRSGLPGGDEIWYGTTANREQVVRAIRNLAPTTSFRTRFQYQNLMFITAGEVVHAVAGQSWDDFIKGRIFQPLGMSQSNTSVKDLVGQPDVATPHAELNGEVRTVPWRNIDNAAAAGAINSNVADMTRWLRLWLGKGTFEGKRLISEANYAEAIRAQFTIDEPGMIARLMSPQFLGYGFGWFVEDFRGRRWVNHGGNIDGMAALVSFLPQDGIGVVVLTNLNHSDIAIPLTANLFDRLLGFSPPKDYNSDYYAASKAYDEKQRAGRPQPVQVEGTKPTLPIKEYAGTYRNAFLGTATVTVEPEGNLAIKYDAAPAVVAGPLEHRYYDSFVATSRDAIVGQFPVTFQIGPDAKVQSMTFMGNRQWTKQ